MIELGAAVTISGSRIVIYRGFKPIATLTRVDAENLSQADEAALRKAFQQWGSIGRVDRQRARTRRFCAIAFTGA
jgi:hypothetical protein